MGGSHPAAVRTRSARRGGAARGDAGSGPGGESKRRDGLSPRLRLDVGRTVQVLQVAANQANSIALPLIAALAIAAGLPAIGENLQFPDLGGLMSYGAPLGEMNCRAGGYIARILHGERAGDLPVMQPESFEFIVNLKAAKGLGINLPESFIQQATQVIE
ncbi:MAG: hypothetical protein EXQ93_07670 [Alphaproteobacteria bacterium]|nr:hypothetical protein [Alphaproteobacteria bacterium]